MAPILNHTIVRANEKWASAEFFARIMGLEVERNSPTHFAPVKVNDNLFFDFDDGRDPVTHEHYAFHVTDEEFDDIFGRVKDEGLSYGSEPFAQDNMQVYDMWGGRGIYFHELNGHSIEIFTRRSPDGSYPPLVSQSKSFHWRRSEVRS